MVLDIGQGGSSKFVDEHVAQYCHLRKKKSSNKMLIQQVISLQLCMILFMVTHIVGSIGAHLVVWSHVKYALMCLEHTIYDWCIGLWVNMHKKLKKCRT